MNRREFITTAAIATTVPGTLIASMNPSNKYPLIGQPFYGTLYTPDVFDRLEKMKGYSPFTSKRVYSVQTATNFVEVIFHKSPFPLLSTFPSMPAVAGYMAYRIVDMETMKTVKDRYSNCRYLQIPDEADKELVLSNRRNHEQTA